MEFVILICVIVFLFIYLLAQDSKKESKKERYGEAVGKFSQKVADKISNTAFSITEPADKKNLRMAKEELASRLGCLYRTDYYFKKKYIEQLLTVDVGFKSVLDNLGISEVRWNKLALMIFYIGTIRKLSRNSSDYTIKLNKKSRDFFLSNLNSENIFKDSVDTLNEALDFYNIRIEEWLEYGDAVIEMHDLYSHPDIKEFGYISSIMPMKNNMHLL